MTKTTIKTFLKEARKEMRELFYASQEAFIATVPNRWATLMDKAGVMYAPYSSVPNVTNFDLVRESGMKEADFPPFQSHAPPPKRPVKMRRVYTSKPTKITRMEDSEEDGEDVAEEILKPE